MLAIIGLDGLCSHTLDTYPTSHLQDLSSQYHYDVLECVCIPHTAPSWATIFTGKLPKEHGVYEFATNIKTKEYMKAWEKPGVRPLERKDITARFTWEILHDKGLHVEVLSVPVTLQFLGLNSPERPGTLEDLLKLFFPSTVEMFRDSLKWHSRNLNLILERPMDLFITVLPFPDKFYHTLEKLKTRAPLFFKRLDNLIGRLKLPKDWIILSDHGRPSLPRIEEPRFKTYIPAHEKEGIIISSLPDVPTRNVDIHNFILEYFEK